MIIKSWGERPFSDSPLAQDVNVFVNEEGMVEIWATFDRSALCSTAPGNRTITVVGSLTNGRDFHGTDTIRIITGNLKCLGELASHWLRGDCTGPHWCDGFDLDRNSEVNFMDLALSECCSYERVD